jgi:hypothetical protein
VANLSRNLGYSDTTFAGSLLALYKAEIVDMPQVYLVATSFFPKLLRTCEVERLIVSCGSRLPLHQESPQCVLFAIFSIG